MVASLNAFLKIEGAAGESKQGDDGSGAGAGEGNYKDWIELQQWEWEVESETSWTKGGGASVGKPNPQKLSFEHYWDTASPQLLGYICTGSAFPEIRLEMCKTVGSMGKQSTADGKTTVRPLVMYFQAVMKECFITKVTTNTSDDGLSQKVEMVFKEIRIDYKRQNNDGSLGAKTTFEWDIPAGKASPSAP